MNLQNFISMVLVAHTDIVPDFGSNKARDSLQMAGYHYLLDSDKKQDQHSHQLYFAGIAVDQVDYYVLEYIRQNNCAVAEMVLVADPWAGVLQFAEHGYDCHKVGHTMGQVFVDEMNY